MEGLVGDQRDDREQQEAEHQSEDHRSGHTERQAPGPPPAHGAPNPAALSFACPEAERTAATKLLAAARLRLALTTAM